MFLLGKQSVSIGETLCQDSPHAAFEYFGAITKPLLTRVENGVKAAQKWAKMGKNRWSGDVR